MFCFLEKQGYLDIADNYDLFCLHYVLLERINAHLKTFSEGYDHHSLRTEANKLHLQLWTCGSITHQPHSDREVEDVRALGIDWDEPVNSHTLKVCF